MIKMKKLCGNCGKELVKNYPYVDLGNVKLCLDCGSKVQMQKAREKKADAGDKLSGL